MARISGSSSTTMSRAGSFGGVETGFRPAQTA
jgi:hypothetical protein